MPNDVGRCYFPAVCLWQLAFFIPEVPGYNVFPHLTAEHNFNWAYDCINKKDNSFSFESCGLWFKRRNWITVFIDLLDVILPEITIACTLAFGPNTFTTREKKNTSATAALHLNVQVSFRPYLNNKTTHGICCFVGNQQFLTFSIGWRMELKLHCHFYIPMPSFLVLLQLY